MAKPELRTMNIGIMNQKSNEPTKTKKAMKTKKFLSMAALALVGAMMTGCSSDDNFAVEQQPENQSKSVTLTTTIGLDDGGTTRALTATGVKTFAAGDQIAVIYTKNGGTVTKAVSEALPAGSYGANATFTVTLDDPDRTQNVTYIYPAAMAGSTGVDYTKLNSQSNGTLTDLGSKYDLATNSGAWNAGALPSLTLNNQLAILAINLKNSTGASDITSTITGVTITDGTNSYAITRSATDGPIYVAIRPTTSADITVTATDGTNNYTKSLTGKTYAANNGYSVSWKMILAGAFTVNGGGTQVHFAQGNLQATYNGSSWTWAFAANQWDYIGNAAGNTSINGNGTVSTNGTVDLFGWVGTSSSWTSAAQWGISASKTIADYGNFADEALKSDWGNVPGIGTGWRTLTSAEWQYLFNTRTTGGTVFGTSSARYAHATINTDGTSVNGMILFPDGVDIASTDVTTAGTVNGTSAWATTCTTAQWSALAAKGCVFLPAAGYREGTSVGTAGSVGYYWSSSPNTLDLSSAYRMYFNSGGLYPASYNFRYRGFSVRLVRQVE